MLLNEMHDDDILMWHGAKKWEGEPELRPSREGRYEAGPGFYCTNKYTTAQKYSKGGGSIILLRIRRNITLASNVAIPLTTIVEFLNSTRIKNRKEIIEDLKANTARHNSLTVFANVLINLIVNYRSGAGKAGLAVAIFLRNNGVDAEIENQSSGEQWMIIYNPKIIKSATKVSSKEVSDEMRHLPSINLT